MCELPEPCHLGKLDKKYFKDDDKLRRCLLIINGINEGTIIKRPRVVVESLLKDIGAE